MAHSSGHAQCLTVRCRPNDLATHDYVNFTRDGGMVMAPESHLLFFFRALFQLVLALCMQLPAKYQVKVDRAKFMQAFEAEIDNEVYRPDSWELGPDGNTCNPDPAQVQRRRKIQEAALLDMYELHAKTIPTASNIAPYRVRMNGPAPQTTLPAKRSQAKKRKAAELEDDGDTGVGRPKRRVYCKYSLRL